MATRIRKVASAGALALFVSLGLASLDAAGIKGLPLAYACIAGMGIIGIVGVLVAESVLAFRSELRGIMRSAGVISVFVICIGLAMFESVHFTDEIMLKPGNVPTPALRAIRDSSETGIILGTSFDEISSFPFDLITMNGRPLFQLDRDANGLKVKQLTLYDDRHNTIASVTDNIIWVRNDVRMEKTPNSLTVYDHNNDVALKIDYLNPHIIQIAGIFRNESFPLLITDKLMKFGVPCHTTLTEDRFHNHQIVQTPTAMEFRAESPEVYSLIVTTDRCDH
jgi:hypothetical protein